MYNFSIKEINLHFYLQFWYTFCLFDTVSPVIGVFLKLYTNTIN